MSSTWPWTCSVVPLNSVPRDEVRVPGGCRGLDAGEAGELRRVDVCEGLLDLKPKGLAASVETIAGEDYREAGRPEPETLLHGPLTLLGRGLGAGESPALELRRQAQSGCETGEERQAPKDHEDVAAAVDEPPKGGEHVGHTSSADTSHATRDPDVTTAAHPGTIYYAAKKGGFSRRATLP
jgi:hypothetical protein